MGKSMRKSLGQEQAWGVQNREGTSQTGRAHILGEQEGKAGRLGKSWVVENQSYSTELRLAEVQSILVMRRKWCLWRVV